MLLRRTTKWVPCASASLEGHIEALSWHAELGGDITWSLSQLSSVNIAAYFLKGFIPGFEMPSWAAGPKLNLGYVSYQLASANFDITRPLSSIGEVGKYSLLTGDAGVKAAVLGAKEFEIDGSFDMLFPEKDNGRVDIVASVGGGGSLQIPAEIGKFIIRIGARLAATYKLKLLMRASFEVAC